MNIIFYCLDFKVDALFDMLHNLKKTKLKKKKSIKWYIKWMRKVQKVKTTSEGKCIYNIHRHPRTYVMNFSTNR